MKKTLAVLASIIGAGAASVAAIAWLNRRKDGKIVVANEGPLSEAEAEGEALVGTICDDEVNRIIRSLAPEKLAVQSPEANRSIELHPNGKLYYYEDGKVIQEATLNSWPEGKFKIHYYRPYDSRICWLFFEALDDGESYFCAERFNEGYTQMDHVMALDHALLPIGLSYAKDDKDDVKTTFHLGERASVFGGKKVSVHAPSTVRCGDEQRTIDSFSYFGEDDDRYYVLKIESKLAYVKTGPDELWKDRELVGFNLVMDCGSYYELTLIGNADLSLDKRCYEDVFGEHDFARFINVCKAFPSDPLMGIMPAFYREINPGSDDEPIADEALQRKKHSKFEEAYPED